MHGDNAPIEPALLKSLTDFLSFRGPDGREVCLDGAVGMGHTLLRATHEAKTERQPASLEGRYRIVADARLDAREELIDELKRAKRNLCSNAADCDLILQAYAAWGTPCIDRLRGDFSFALWDAHHKQLFCARDHFGIKPFYYAQLGEIFICSNTLNSIRLHPRVKDDLNDLAIADFLLFDMIRETGATSFTDIKRLPPAHILLCEGRSISVRRYWTLPVSPPLRHGRQRDCVDQFRELLDRAVGDRVRVDSVGVLMSGGLDSSTVAASARQTLSCNGHGVGVSAYTDVFESLIPHEERHYATLVAEVLKIPIEFHLSDQVGLRECLNHQDHCWPEPIHRASCAKSRLRSAWR